MHWLMKNGHYIATQDMDIDHLFNALSMILRKAKGNKDLLVFLLDSILQAKADIISKTQFSPNGDMEEQFNEFDEDDEDILELDTF